MKYLIMLTPRREGDKLIKIGAETVEQSGFGRLKVDGADLTFDFERYGVSITTWPGSS